MESACHAGGSGLPEVLWAEAAVTICYIRIRSPATAILGRDKTPWEIFFGKAPDMSNMRIFGAQAHALIPQELRRKLDSPSEIGQFVGYPANTLDKGYRIALPFGNVIISDDVHMTFAEEVTWNQIWASKPMGHKSEEPQILEIELGSPQEAGAEPPDPANDHTSGDDGDEGNGDDGSEQGDAPGPAPRCPAGPGQAGTPAQRFHPSRARSAFANWWEVQSETGSICHMIYLKSLRHSRRRR